MSYKQKQIAWPLFALLVLALASVLLARARSQIIPLPSAPSDQQGETLNSTTVEAEVRGEKKSSPIGSAHPEQATSRESGPVQMVRFTLFKQGIYPREIRVRTGLVNLAIEDKTNSSSGLAIEREAERERIGEVRCAEGSKRGREVLRLTPGRYTVSDNSRPGNKAKLVVEP